MRIYEPMIPLRLSLSTDLTHLDHPGLAISISDSDARLAETRDGVLLDIVVHNALPCVCPHSRFAVAHNSFQSKGYARGQDLSGSFRP